MIYLRNSYLILAFFICGCASSFYKVTKQRGMKAELSVSSDRVATTCSDAKSDEDEVFIFDVNILDDKNTIIIASQGNNSDKETCEWRKKAVDNILHTGKKIYIAGMGYTNEPIEMQTYGVHIPRHGDFLSNGRYLQLMIVANENGKCYGAYLQDDEPCPGGEFPIREDEYY